MVGSEGKRKGEKEEGGRHFFDDQAKTCRDREEWGKKLHEEEEKKRISFNYFFGAPWADVTAGVKKPPAKA